MREYSESIALKISDCDARGRWKLSGALTVMQEIAEVNAGMWGCGRKELVDELGMCWVLYRLKIEFDELPRMGDALTVTTWPGGVQGLFFLRYFAIEAEGGRLIGEAVTTWVLFDLGNRRVLRPRALPVDPPAFDGRSCRLSAPEALDTANAKALMTRTVRFTELDMNGHMNNARYADWIQDALAGDERAIRAMQINFIHEARLGDEYELALDTHAGGALIAARRPGEAKNGFEAEVRY